jgi:hypothetical protein
MKRSTNIPNRIDPRTTTAVRYIRRAMPILCLAALAWLASNAPAQTVDLKKGLIAYYPFNGNANDESGNGHNAIAKKSSATTDRTGKPNKAWNLVNNINSMVRVPSNAAFTFNTEFTISIWAKFNQPWSYHAESLIWKELYTSNMRYNLGVDQNNNYGKDKYSISFYAYGIQTPIKALTYSDISKWNHIVGVYSSGTLRCYLNGNLYSSIMGTPTKTDANSDFVIGGAAHPVSGAYNRDVDDVMVYDRALSLAEVAALYELDGGAKPTPAGDSTYQIVQGSFTWLEAKADAETRGGHLAVITSRAENDTVWGMVAAIDSTKSPWLGGTDEGTEGKWRWITGEEWNHTNWNGGEPSNLGGEHFPSILGASQQHME